MPEKYKSNSYLNQTYGSAIRFEAVARSLGLPKDVSWMVIIDIGSSVSNTVKRLNEQGAYAYGVDFQYSSLEKLVGSVEPSFTNPERWNFPIARRIHPRLRGKEDPDLQPSPWNPLNRLKNAISESFTDYQIWGRASQYLRTSERVYKEFLEDLHSPKRKGQYVAGFAEQLPFQDNIAHLAYSVAAISVFVIRDRKAFMQSVNEALRITMLGGRVILDPWFEGKNPVWSPTEQRNAQVLLESLRARSIEFSINYPVRDESAGGVLHIVKS